MNSLTRRFSQSFVHNVDIDLRQGRREEGKEMAETEALTHTVSNYQHSVVQVGGAAED